MEDEDDGTWIGMWKDYRKESLGMKILLGAVIIGFIYDAILMLVIIANFIYPHLQDRVFAQMTRGFAGFLFVSVLFAMGVEVLVQREKRIMEVCRRLDRANKGRE